MPYAQRRQERKLRYVHVLVAEEKLGRALFPGEVVHHINGDKEDNRPENLEVLPSQSEHAKLHRAQAEPRHCEVDGCEREHYGHGMCSMHWQRARYAVTLCSVPDCERHPRVQGMCAHHYRLVARGEP